MGIDFKPKQVKGFTQTYVVFSTTKGIYLGDDNWSQHNPGDKEAAPVHEYGDALNVLHTLTEAGHTDCTMKECWPDRVNGTTASKATCAAAALPSW